MFKYLIGFVIILLLGGLASQALNKKPATTVAPEKTGPVVPQMKIDNQKNYQAILNTTKGKITIELLAAKTPTTVNNFVLLAKKGFYNNTRRFGSY